MFLVHTQLFRKLDTLSISEGELVMNCVFVYGSMAEGMVHFKKIHSAVIKIDKAKVMGSAYQLPCGYPVILSEGTDFLPGQIVELKSPEFLIPLLDEFYGFSVFDPAKSLHFRHEIKVSIENGEQVTCWAYFLNPKKLPTNAKSIPAADWEEKLNSPKFMDQLTSRQIQFIQKLSRISGRDVVPIDLTLYRELMSLELIVDKGRRLALSKFGQEVCRYLPESQL
jgi:gamma-glutamylcyclotransferase (GGCT)/AIG2-like uncharacterized protein YtfP